MTKNCTSIEQSRKLLELGIDVNTADMYYPNRVGMDNYALSVEWKNGLPLLSQEIPAWSLTALLEILHYPTLSQDFNHNWTCNSFGKEMEPVCDWKPQENAVDACYEMILKLHELNLL